MMKRAINVGYMLVGCLVWVSMGFNTWAQGSLTPPGAPAPTMKTLSQVEPRTAITNIPYTISQPGSYYFTTNLTGAGTGVVINASGVTLDLMGFTLAGDSGLYDFGVFINGSTNAPIMNVVVRNGRIQKFGTGIWATVAQGHRYEQLAIVSNMFYGIRLTDSVGNWISDCAISYMLNDGIILNCSPGASCSGNTITHCTIMGNAEYGIYFAAAQGACNGNTISKCMITGNESHGIYFYGGLGQCNGNSILDSTICANGSDGVHLTANSGQCNANTLSQCMISGNAGFGFYCSGATGESSGNSVLDCQVHNNVGRGIFFYLADGNRIEGNHVAGQTGSPSYGIWCNVTTKCMVFRNTCVGQSNNFIISTNDTYGPIVSSSGELSATGAAANAWANFSR